MKRINHHLSNKQIVILKRLSDEQDLSVAELIRRAIDNWINIQIKNEVDIEDYRR